MIQIEYIQWNYNIYLILDMNLKTWYAYKIYNFILHLDLDRKLPIRGR